MLYKLQLRRLLLAGEPLDFSGYIVSLIEDTNPKGTSMKELYVRGWAKRSYAGIVFVRCENRPTGNPKRGYVWEESSESEMREYMESLGQ